jgi:hypothetical protein
MKYYKAIEDSTTDVNGAWKPLKPISEGFEFVGDEDFDNLIGRKAKERRDARQDKRQDRKDVKNEGRVSGLSRGKARRDARKRIPTNKPARREAYLTLVRLNFRGFAYRLDSIISGTDTKLINQLKEKWNKWGDWNQLVEAVNKGKEKKPLVCGAKCRKEILDTKNFSNVLAESTITALVGLAGVVISALSGIVKQGQIGKQQRDAIESAEKEGQDDFNNLPPEEQEAIRRAEQELQNELNASDNKKNIFIGIGIVALLGIGYLLFKNKK